MTIDEAIERLDGRKMSASSCYSIVKCAKDNTAIDMAITALRAQQEAEKNDPLTLDELREMDGQPYYHVSLQGGKDHWTILDTLIARHIDKYHYGERWLAYRRPPKEKENE